MQNLETLLDGFEGTAPADKGFIDEHRQSFLLEWHNIRRPERIEYEINIA
jgi:hypothetical protein